ncbi:hypothetical protein ACSFA8_19415 [Variovorax sp. RT4R15]|uniref:hypothetical protein n=1 Tax=Variovorax sp. RT4R15 TaxID=3443737 RepID=UPI003F44D643
MTVLTGCASVTHGTTQSVTIETLTAGGQVVEGAECRVANDKRDAVMLSGQSLSVRRSSANLSIECTQPGHAPANGQATSRVNTGMVGNILIGGLVGAAIDSGTGAGFNYPSWMQLVFGEVRTFDRSSQSGNQPMAGVKVGETRLAAAPPPPAPPFAPERAAAAPVAAAVVPTPTAVPTPPVASAPRAPEPATRVSMDDLKALLPAKP